MASRSADSAGKQNKIMSTSNVHLYSNFPNANSTWFTFPYDKGQHALFSMSDEILYSKD